MQAPGSILPGMYHTIVLKETDYQHDHPEPKRPTYNRQMSIILCITPNRSEPFVTWDRQVTWETNAPHDEVATVCFGNYHRDLDSAVKDFDHRVRIEKNKQALAKRGRADGEAAAYWVVDGNTDDPAGVLKKLLDGIEEGDPEITESLPQPRLSGEWAGDPTWSDILNEECDPDTTDEEKEDDTDWQIEYEDEFARGVDAKLQEMYKWYSGEDYVRPE